MANVSYALVEAGMRVLAIDLDPQGALASILGLQEEALPTPKVFLQSLSPDQVVRSTNFQNLFLIPGPSPEMEIESGMDELAPNHILDWIGAHGIRDQYDYVFFDLPASFGPVVEAALAASDCVLVIKEADALSFRLLPHELTFLKKIRQQYNPFLRLIGILVNKFDARDDLMNDVWNALRDQYGEVLIESSIPWDTHVMEAAAVGKPVIVYERISSGARAFLKAVQEIGQREIRKS